MSEVQALRKEIVELRKQVSALSVAIVELAANRHVQYVPYVAPVPFYRPPTSPWNQPYNPQPYITWGNTTPGMSPEGAPSMISVSA